MSLLANALSRILSGLLDSTQHNLTVLYIFVWDAGLSLFNAFAPNRPKGALVALGKPGHGGVWPEYRAPREGDSRSPCPALNAMANHGILPRDGRDISYKLLKETIHTTYNFSPTFCFYVPLFFSRLQGRSYWTDTMDLSDLAMHNGIEHDASLCRHDAFHSPDQSKPAQDLIDRLLASATGPNNTLTPADLSRFSEIRRAESKAANGQFTLSAFFKIFGSSNSSTMLTIMGGRVDWLRDWLKEERLPDGFESACRYPMGLTIAQFNATVLRVEFGIREPAAGADYAGVLASGDAKKML